MAGLHFHKKFSDSMFYYTNIIGQQNQQQQQATVSKIADYGKSFVRK